MTDNPRLQSVYALVKVLGQHQTLDQALAQDTQPLVRELVAGSLRHYFSLSKRIDELLTRKLRSKDLDVRALMLIGAYQLLHTRIPDHAAVAETVSCTKQLKKPWAKGLVNAVLRNLPPPTEEWSPAALNDHPHWFINLLRNSLPDHWSEVIKANNSRAPMTLRVNSAKISPADYAKILESNNIEFEPGALPETLNLKTPRAQKKLPGFEEGLVSVQDAAAQLAVSVAQPTAGLRVLDACAAPGGKGFHLFEQLQKNGEGVDLYMHDVSPARVKTLQEQASRLGHTNRGGLHIAQQDSSAVTTEQEAPYDLILLDAPCTGSGTVRRHPDIKVLRDQLDLKALNKTQATLLDALWARLAPGGRLIYSTCSLFQEENDAIISAFIERQRLNSQQISKQGSQPTEGSTVHIGAIAERIPLNHRTPFISTQHGIQTLPTVEGGDGLYYAELIASI